MDSFDAPVYLDLALDQAEHIDLYHLSLDEFVKKHITHFWTKRKMEGVST